MGFIRKPVEPSGKVCSENASQGWRFDLPIGPAPACPVCPVGSSGAIPLPTHPGHGARRDCWGFSIQSRQSWCLRLQPCWVETGVDLRPSLLEAHSVSWASVSLAVQ